MADVIAREARLAVKLSPRFPSAVDAIAGNRGFLGAAPDGRCVTRHQLDRAATDCVAVVDLGLGDGGYKREMGARPGPEVADLLLVRRRTLAALLSLH